jgi:hypothetical protein
MLTSYHHQRNIIAGYNAPNIFDQVELQLRLPVKRPHDRIYPDAGLTIPLLRIL